MYSPGGLAWISSLPMLVGNPSVLPEIVEVDLRRMRLQWHVLSLPSSAHINNGLQWWIWSHSVLNPGCSSDHPPVLSAYLDAANPRSVLKDVLRSLSFSIWPLCVPEDACLMLRNAGTWHEPFVQLSPCSFYCRLAAALSSKPLKLSFSPGQSPSFHSFLLGVEILSQFLFFFLFKICPTQLSGDISCNFSPRVQ